MARAEAQGSNPEVTTNTEGRTPSLATILAGGVPKIFKAQP